MSLEVSIDTKKEFEAVTEMIQPAVLADVVDKGEQPNPFKPGTTRPRGYFCWIVAEQDAGGRNKRVFESFTLSLKGDRSALKARLKELGKLPKEGEKLQLESLIGIQRTLVLAEEDSKTPGGKPFIKITATMKPTAVVEIPGDFVRAKDKEQKG